MSTSILTTTNQMNHVAGMDKHLTSNPQTSLFTNAYARISPLSKHTSNISFNEKVKFGKTITATIPVFGDVLSSMYFYVKLPPLPLAPGSKFTGWTNCVGYAMIDYVELRINECVIVRKSGREMETRDYLETNADKTIANYKATGKYDTVEVVTINAGAPQDLYIPLQFWFTKELRDSLPLFILGGGQPVKIVIGLKTFEDCITFDGPTVPTEQVILDSGLVVDYYILSKLEKDTYKLVDSDEYAPLSLLIEQNQEIMYEIPHGLSTNKFSMDFINPVKDIVVVIAETESEKNNDHFNYGRRSLFPGGEFLTHVTLLFEGKTRFEKLPESYYRLILPQRHYSFAGNRNIYTLPFAQYPEKMQPTGSVNFSTYDHVDLSLDFVSGLPQLRLYAFAKSYNMLTISPQAVQLEYM